MFPIFAVIAAALSAAIAPVAKAVALAAVGGAAAFGTNKALTAITQKTPPKPAHDDLPNRSTTRGTPSVGVALNNAPMNSAQAYQPEPFMRHAPTAPCSSVMRL